MLHCSAGGGFRHKLSLLLQPSHVGMSMTTSDIDGEFPAVGRDGATSVWIVAQISKSPILSIDQQRSDFESLQGQHWYVQEVLPEQVPQEWRDVTERLLKEQLEAAAAAKIEQPR